LLAKGRAQLQPARADHTRRPSCGNGRMACAIDSLLPKQATGVHHTVQAAELAPRCRRTQRLRHRPRVLSQNTVVFAIRWRRTGNSPPHLLAVGLGRPGRTVDCCSFLRWNACPARNEQPRATGFSYQGRRRRRRMSARSPRGRLVSCPRV